LKLQQIIIHRGTMQWSASFTNYVTEHFSGPGRVINVVCMCVQTITSEQDIWHAGSTWHYLGQVQRSKLKVKHRS